MILARWSIDARFGYKQAVIDSMKEWQRNIGPQVGWTADRVRLLTGSVGAHESLEIVRIGCLLRILESHHIAATTIFEV